MKRKNKNKMKSIVIRINPIRKFAESHGWDLGISGPGQIEKNRYLIKVLSWFKMTLWD